MKSKRLNHYADAIIGILNGYQIYRSHSYFDKYGEGEYYFNLNNGELKFNGNNIDPFPIFRSIKDWFDKDVKKHTIDVENFHQTTVEISVFNKHQKELRFVKRKWLFFPIFINHKWNEYDMNILVNIITDQNKHYSKKSTGLIWQN